MNSNAECKGIKIKGLVVVGWWFLLHHMQWGNIIAYHWNTDTIETESNWTVEGVAASSTVTSAVVATTSTWVTNKIETTSNWSKDAILDIDKWAILEAIPIYFSDLRKWDELRIMWGL